MRCNLPAAHREIDRRLRSAAEPPSLYLVVSLLVSFAAVFGLQFYLFYGNCFWQFAAMLCLAFALLRAACSHDRASVLCLVVLAWILAAVGWNRHWFQYLVNASGTRFRDEMPDHFLIFVFGMAPALLLSIPIALLAQGRLAKCSRWPLRWIALAGLVSVVDALATLVVWFYFFHAVGSGEWFTEYSLRSLRGF